jgi:hypothetical protein
MKEIIDFIGNPESNTVLERICDFYKSAPWHPILMVLIFWIFWPGAMFYTAHILEGRKVYLGKGQSRMFFPGDFMLGVGTVAFIGIHTKSPVGWSWVYSKGYAISTCIFFFVVMAVFRHFDTKRYKKRAKNSPTKLAHDLSGYWICAWTVLGLGIPQIVWTLPRMELIQKAPTEWKVFLFAGLFFLAMTIYDITHMPGEEELDKMHPSDYLLPWQRKRQS